MLTLNEFIELRDKLINNEIGIEFVKKKLESHWQKLKEGKRSWHTKDWIERRKKFIKEKCEICSSTEILTIQHKSPRKTYNDFKKKIIRAYTNNNNEIDKTIFRNHALNDYEYVPILLCPKCKSKNPYERKRTKPKYRCQDCKYEFEEAIFRSASELISVFIEDEDAYKVSGMNDRCFEDKWGNKHILSYVKIFFQKNIAINKNAESIEKETLTRTLDEDIKYLSFEDTMTACKKCASNYDLHAMELCPKCNKNYKGIEYPTCIECLPEEKQKEINEQKEFNKQMRDRHKKLGID